VGEAKRLIVKPISAKDARRIIQSLHYSGKVDPRSQLHLGVFLDGKCGGAMQFGPSMDKRKMLGIVSDAKWNDWLELNRMAFADWLPRNGESRALGFAMRFLKKTYPHLRWVISFADGTQCGDGTIYRASGFDLTGIKQNSTMFKMPSGESVAKIVLEPGFSPNSGAGSIKARLGVKAGESANHFLNRVGAQRIPGFQLRYIYFLDPTARQRLTVPILPFSEIDRRGAGMYRGKPRVRSVDSDTSVDPDGRGRCNSDPDALDLF